MEIPVINRISDFEAGLSSLQNPSFLSQIFALSGIEKIHEACSFWKWGALILALLASFTTIINRIKILILRLRHVNHSLPSLQPFQGGDEDYDSETDASYSSSDDEETEDDDEEEEFEIASSSSQKWRQGDEDFRVRGSAHLDDEHWQSSKFGLRRRRCAGGSFGDLFSLSDLALGKNVVNLWDNLGLGFRLDVCKGSASSGSVLTVHDVSKAQDVAAFLGVKPGLTFPAVSSSTSSPAVVVAAGESQSGSISLNGWDTRARSCLPSIIAEWRPRLGRIVGVNLVGGLGKVYVSDDVNGQLTVGDMRKPSSPFADLTEGDMETWWDADAVIVTDEACRKANDH